MEFSVDSALQLPAPRHPILRYLLALATVAVATLVRWAVDPLLHDQVPFFIYVAAVVIATWFTGTGGGVFATVVASFVGNYFFVPPRHELSFTTVDAAAMVLFALVSLGLVWTVGRWKADITEKEVAAALASRRAEELRVILDTVPAAVFIAQDPDARTITGNRAASEMLRLTHGANLSKTAPEAERPSTFRVFSEGKELPSDDLPVQRAARGLEAREIELDVVYGDGTTRTIFGSACPLHGSGGGTRGSVASFVNVTERKRLESEVRRRMEELESIYDFAPIGLAVLDRDGRFVRINRRLAEINGRSVEEHVGRTIGEAVPQLEDVTRPLMERVLGGEAVLDVPVSAELPSSPGTPREFLEQWFPIRDETGEVTGVNVVVSEVTEFKRAETELRRKTDELERHVRELAESEARYRIMGETLPYGVWLAGPDGGARYVSDSFLELLDMTQEEQQQFGWTRRLVPGDVEPMLKKWLHCIQTGEMWDSEHRIVDRHGEIRTVLTRGLPVRDADGHITSWVGVNLDITQRKLMEGRLREQAEELAQANRMKDEFLSVLSHELRTPLNAILGWSEMLLRHGLDETATGKALEAINRNARAQAALINDVLDVSRIVSGKLRLDVRPTDVAAVVHAALDTIKPAADAKRIRIDASVDRRVMLIADPERLQQVVWNLLSNSVKFTHAGGCIEVSARQVASQVEITVRDNGTGISPDFLPHVFERFRQRDSSTTRAQQTGLGLGLAIVRHLTELHGGTVHVESAGEGQGAEFIVRLPVRAVFEPQTETERTAEQAALHEDPPARHDALAGVRVLVVDDQADARSLLESALRHVGALVLVCGSGRDALETLQCERVDVLIADIGMPEMDGYEFMRRLRSQIGVARGIPAIALTAFGGPEDRRRALDAGYHEHIAKPVLPDHLIAVVASLARGCPSV